ncbi:DUF3883 domain-containing protein [Pseudovibrio axinellae]|uniref:DUF3883 domain-containing protein n=1 Tax=Pseudovibrio axinellae TaxID=989403 RepID=UPI00137B5C97|nr:DUF3883 domain-containing protein [Pseudovibrio axinellae]
MDYFEMLRLDLRGQAFNKAARRRALTLSISRSDKAIEFKQQNVSAVLEGLQHPWVTGLRPAKNYQGSLAEAVQRFLNHQNEISFEDISQSFIEIDEVSAEYTPPALPQALTIKPKATASFTRRPQVIDYAKRDANNRELGKLGEEFILQAEKERLDAAGSTTLAEKVIWASKEQGDGLGYDILSYSEDGKQRFIEVKTTNGGCETPFFISQNEVDFAAEEPNNYILMRVYDFSTNPKVFELQVPLEDHVELTPTIYKASFK